MDTFKMLAEYLDEYMHRRVFFDERERFMRFNRIDGLFGGLCGAELFARKLRFDIAAKTLAETEPLLRGAGISPVHFKGVTTALELYGDVRMRPFGDMDIYVGGALERACKVLGEAGYEVTEEYDGHHTTVSRNRIPIELHSHFFHPGDGLEFSPDFTRLRNVTVCKREVQVLDCTDLFVLLVLHGFVHSKKGGKYKNLSFIRRLYVRKPVNDLMHMCDIALLFKKYGDRIDLDRAADMLSQAADDPDFELFIKEADDVFHGIMPEKIMNICPTSSDLSDDYAIARIALQHRDESFDRAVLRYLSAKAEKCGSVRTVYTVGSTDAVHFSLGRENVIAGELPEEEQNPLSFDFLIKDGMLFFTFDIEHDVRFADRAQMTKVISDGAEADNITLVLAAAGERYSYIKPTCFFTREADGRMSLEVLNCVKEPEAFGDGIVSSLEADGGHCRANVGISLALLHAQDGGDIYFNVIACFQTDDGGCALSFVTDGDAWNGVSNYPVIKRLHPADGG